MKILFIGGMLDGKWVDDPKFPMWQVQEELPKFPTPISLDAKIVRHTYYRADIHVGTVYLLTDLTRADAIQLLIKHYKPWPHSQKTYDASGSKQH